jgi:hypothetical protein
MDNDDYGGVAGPDDEPPRCQMAHREVDEGLEPCDAMNAHQSARNRCFGTALRPFLEPHRPLDNGGGVEVCMTERLVEPSTAARGMSVVMQSTTNEAVTTRLGSRQAPASARRPARTMWLCSPSTQLLEEEWMCRSTQHILDWLLDAMDGTGRKMHQTGKDC